VENGVAGFGIDQDGLLRMICLCAFDHCLLGSQRLIPYVIDQDPDLSQRD
jgi:hypothetical protein